MTDSLFLVIGLVFGMLFAITVTLVLISQPRERKINQKATNTLTASSVEQIKAESKSIRDDMEKLEKRFWIYGVEKEEENKKWRRVYRDFASKTINTLYSCWIGREDDATSRATYNELMTGLKAVGIEEIIPVIGQPIKEDQDDISIRSTTGVAPFNVSKVILPGYRLNSRHLDTLMLLAPAVVEVTGKE